MEQEEGDWSQEEASPPTTQPRRGVRQAGCLCKHVGFREGLASFVNHRDVSCGVPFPWTAQTQGNPLPPSPLECNNQI